MMLGIAFQVETQKATNSEHFLDPFNAAVQKRFHNVIGFGMARLASERRFRPETPEEKQVVNDLTRDGYQISLFLAAREILQDVPVSYRVSYAKMGSGFDLMNGPVVVGEQKLKGLPDGAAMWEGTREALRQFERGSERWAFAAGEWDVEARPVRASEDKCLKCHASRQLIFEERNGGATMRYGRETQALNIGDPIGALLYVYKRKD